jgi:CBS domain-containing protein
LNATAPILRATSSQEIAAPPFTGFLSRRGRERLRRTRALRRGRSCSPIREFRDAVETILAAKGTDVTTIEPTATVEYGIGILAERGIGALVVVGADHRVNGLLSERDTVRALAERGASVLTEPLARVMTRTESTCTLSEPVNSIMEQITSGKFRHVPVVEQERLVGIVSIGDVVKRRVTEMERESEALHEYIQKA